MLFNADTFCIVPFAAPCAVWVIVCAAACAIFIFEESDITFAVLILLELAVNAILAVLKTASPCQNRVNILLRNGKSRGFLVLCFGYHFYLFFYGWEIGNNFVLIGNAALGRLWLLGYQL